MKLYVRLSAPFEWVRVSGQDVQAFGEVASLAEYPTADEDELIGVVAGEWVTTHRISLPAKTRRQFQAAVPYALEESISEDVDQLHFVCPAWKANQVCTVYVVAKEKMLDWQRLANEFQLPLDRLVPDYSLVPFHESAECSLALVTMPVYAKSQEEGENDESTQIPAGVEGWQEQFVAHHQTLGGVSLDPDFLDIWLMDVPLSATIAVNDQAVTERLIGQYPDRDFRHWAFGNKIAHWLEHVPANPYDLLSDEYRPSVRHMSWRSLAIPAALFVAAIFVSGLYDTYRYFSLHSEIASIDQEQQQIIKDVFPELGYVAPNQERFMMEQALTRMSGVPQSSSAQSMLAETAAVLRRQNVTLANIIYRDSEMIITCQLSDFSQVDLLTNQLNARPRINARLQSSAADDGEIMASYRLTTS